MNIKIIYDKRAINKKLNTGWGVSFLINDKILFDTGEKGEWLLENIRLMSLDINKIEGVVISHDHWDHWGGLWDILNVRKGLKVYACPGFSSEFKEKAKKYGANLIESGSFMEISPDIHVTGEIPGEYKGKNMPEQAAVLKTKNGLTIITGCAHPGIVKMIEKVKAEFPKESVFFVMGGFHFMEADTCTIETAVGNFKKSGVIKAGPTHCSGEKAESIFKKHYEADFVPVKAGQEIEV